ncbi:MAG: hypothetical protein K0U47_02950 [Epsilonproteobacteria bacterium]|nr:hypothetical protein [Campylobacterota bacterium]
MVFYRYLTLLGWGVSSLYSFSAQPSAIDKVNFATIPNKDTVCHEGLETTMQLLSTISNVEIATKAFMDDSVVYISNQPQGYFKNSAPMQGFKDKHLKFLLYFEGKRCMLGMVNEEGVSLNSQVITKCHCVRSSEK